MDERMKVIKSQFMIENKENDSHFKLEAHEDGGPEVL